MRFGVYIGINPYRDTRDLTALSGDVFDQVEFSG